MNICKGKSHIESFNFRKSSPFILTRWNLFALSLLNDQLFLQLRNVKWISRFVHIEGDRCGDCLAKSQKGIRITRWLNNGADQTEVNVVADGEEWRRRLAMIIIGGDVR